MFILMVFFMHLGLGFSPFGDYFLPEKIFIDERETECWAKSFLDSHDFHFFLQHVS